LNPTIIERQREKLRKREIGQGREILERNTTTVVETDRVGKAQVRVEYGAAIVQRETVA